MPWTSELTIDPAARRVGNDNDMKMEEISSKNENMSFNIY